MKSQPRTRRTGKLASKSSPKTRSSARRAPITIDEYLATVPEVPRAALEKLRRQIRTAIPGAVECISYGVPAFRLNDRFLVAFAAAKQHCSFFPGGVVTGFEDELKNYSTSKGTIRFQPDKPLPATLLRKLIKARIARDTARVEARKVRPKPAGRTRASQ